MPTPRRPSTPDLMTLGLGLLLLWSLFDFVRRLIFLFGTFYSVDMPLFIRVAEDYLSTGYLYPRSDDLARLYKPASGVYKYPPFFQLSIAPWFDLGGTDLGYYRAVRALMLAMYLGSAFLIVRLSARLLLPQPHERAKYYLLAALATLWFNPFRASHGMTTEIPILFFLSLSIATWTARPMLSGALLSVAASLKVYPLLLIAQGLFSRNRYLCLGFALGLVAALCISLAYFGLGEHRFYFMDVFPVILQEKVTTGHGNLNLPVLLASLHAIESPETLFILQRWGVLIGLCLFTWCGSHTTPAKGLMLSSLWICGLLMTLANYWYQYQLLLLIPALALLAWAAKCKSPQIFILLFFSLLPLFIDNEWSQLLLSTAIQNQQLDIAVLQERLRMESPILLLLEISPLYVLTSLIIGLRPLTPLLLLSFIIWHFIRSSRVAR